MCRGSRYGIRLIRVDHANQKAAIAADPVAEITQTVCAQWNSSVEQLNHGGRRLLVKCSLPAAFVGGGGARYHFQVPPIQFRERSDTLVKRGARRA